MVPRFLPLMRFLAGVLGVAALVVVAALVAPIGIGICCSSVRANLQKVELASSAYSCAGQSRFTAC